LQVRYEQLRQKHLDGAGGWAMGVFLQEGMCGWMRASTDRVPQLMVPADIARKKIHRRWAVVTMAANPWAHLWS
jgi:hypothetical protein